MSIIKTKLEITKEEFDYMTMCTLDDYHQKCCDLAKRGGFHPAGYDMFHEHIKQEGNTYYFIWDHYDSCD